MTTHLSPRPPLDFGAVKMSPLLLQWTVNGFGFFVLVNFMQNMKVTDEKAHRVITRSPTMIWGPLSDRLNLRFPGSRRAWVALFAMAVSPIMSFWVYFAPDTGGFYLRFIAYSLVLTGWMPPLYAIMYDHVLPRMRGVTTSVYLLAMTIIGLGCGPYLVGMISDATGHLRTAMLCVNAAAIPIVILMLIIARRARHDEDRLVANVAGATT